MFSWGVSHHTTCERRLVSPDSGEEVGPAGGTVTQMQDGGPVCAHSSAPKGGLFSAVGPSPGTRVWGLEPGEAGPLRLHRVCAGWSPG